MLLGAAAAWKGLTMQINFSFIEIHAHVDALPCQLFGAPAVPCRKKKGTPAEEPYVARTYVLLQRPSWHQQTRRL